MTAASDHELACRRVTAWITQRWLRMYAASKLRKDPAFPLAYELFRERDGEMADIGCGVGLLAFYLRERGCTQRIVGVDTDARKIAIARDIAARAGYAGLEFHDGDAVESAPRFEGDVVLFDVVHYLRPQAQAALLGSVARQLQPGRLAAIRDAINDGSVRFALTQMSEKFAQAIMWNVGRPLSFPTRAGVRAFFPAGDFDESVEPLWGNTPFNNHLFIFRRRTGEAVPAGESHNGSRRP